MQPWIHFLEGGGTYMFASAVSSGSRPLVWALAGHERHPERDRDYRIELEGFGLVGCGLFFSCYVLVLGWVQSSSFQPADGLYKINFKKNRRGIATAP